MTTNIKDKITISILALGVVTGLLAIYASFRLHPAQPAFAATTYTVTKVADTNDGTCDADCSLREAITAANSNAGADIIEFNITPADGTAYTITPLSELPTITEQLKIDGTAQSGSSCSARTLKVEIDGTNETYGLQTTANNFELYGVAINRVAGLHGVRVLNASNPTISCNNFGTDVTGTTAGIGNAQDGVALENVTGGTVGSTTLADRNIMAGNGQAGVELVDGTNGVNVIGNYIGTDFAGTTAIGNAYGVAVWGANGNTIGGTTSTSRNIISGNTTGVAINDDNDPDPSTNNVVEGNYIGMQPNGTTALSNTGVGVTIQGGATGNTVGGTTGVTLDGNCTGACNVISGNGNSGIYLNGVGVTSNTLAGNFIGTDYTGALDRGNTLLGIAVNAASSNTIGGTTAGSRNIISGNNSVGIGLDGNSDNNTIAGNYIGTNTTGASAVANSFDGITISDGSSGNTIGGDTAAARNVISGNNYNGVTTNGTGNPAGPNNVIAGNYIGLAADGVTDLGNGQSGVGLYDVDGTTVGGTTAGSRNIISGNNSVGIGLDGNSDNNTIAGNYIGTNTTGASAVANSFDGITISDGSSGNTIGGDTAAARNVISGNNYNGVTTNGTGNPAGPNNVIAGNYIGLAADGVTDLGNGQSGVGLYDVDGTTVGGTSEGARNIISGNTQNGVQLQIASSAALNNNQILGNYIGTDYTGTTDVQNDEQGITTSVGTGTGNVIGGTTTAARNVISGNVIFGISVSGNMTVLGNYVGLSADGNTVIPNGTVGQRASILVLGNDNIIGGSASGSANYVAGTPSQAGISVQGGTPFGGSSANNNTVQGNCIGTNKNCQYEAGYGNAYAGILVMADAYNTLIGGTTAGAGNTIAGNGAGIINLGIATFYPLGTSILGNSIYQNSGGPISQIGIDNLQTTNFSTFINQNVTLNDDNDIDYDVTNTGPNHYLNFPVINSITSTNGTATINYDLDINDSEANATGYRVEFFANDSPDATGYGQGQTYLGSDTVSGDVTGRQATITLPAGVDGSKYISAVTIMTTDAVSFGFGHSSEFAANVQATLVPASPTPTPANILATTGRNMRWILPLAIALITIGGFALFVVYKKRQQQNL